MSEERLRGERDRSIRTASRLAMDVAERDNLITEYKAETERWRGLYNEAGIINERLRAALREIAKININPTHDMRRLLAKVRDIASAALENKHCGEARAALEELEGLLRLRYSEIDKLKAEIEQLRADNAILRLKSPQQELQRVNDELRTENKKVLIANGEFAARFCAAEDANIELREALERIDQWSKAYPLDIFREPDLVKARALLEAGGMTLDAISAHAMRHVVEGVGKIAREALTELRSPTIL